MALSTPKKRGRITKQDEKLAELFEQNLVNNNDLPDTSAKGEISKLKPLVSKGTQSEFDIDCVDASSATTGPTIEKVDKGIQCKRRYKMESDLVEKKPKHEQIPTVIEESRNENEHDTKPVIDIPKNEIEMNFAFRKASSEILKLPSKSKKGRLERQKSLDERKEETEVTLIKIKKNFVEGSSKRKPGKVVEYISGSTAMNVELKDTMVRKARQGNTPLDHMENDSAKPAIKISKNLEIVKLPDISTETPRKHQTRNIQRINYCETTTRPRKLLSHNALEFSKPTKESQLTSEANPTKKSRNRGNAKEAAETKLSEITPKKSTKENGGSETLKNKEKRGNRRSAYGKDKKQEKQTEH